MQISKTWECPNCGHEMRRGLRDEPPDNCPKCGWPKVRKEEVKEEFNPDDWPAR